MVASRVRGKRPHAPKSSVATIAPWDLEKDDVQADPTAISGKADTAGGDERRRRPIAAPGYWRQHVHKESARNTGSPKARSGMTNQTPVRERLGTVGWRRGV